jgi:hypothetical protein
MPAPPGTGPVRGQPGGDPSVSIPYLLLTSISAGTPGGAGAGSRGPSAGRPSSPINRSKLVGVVICKPLTGPADTTNAWGMPRGKKTKSPGPACHRLSPQLTWMPPSSR